MNKTALLVSRLLWTGTVVSGAAIAAGCSSSSSTPTSCTPGTTLACQCPGGNSFGTQRCGSSTCDCGGVDAAGPGSGDAASTTPPDTGVSEPLGDGGHKNDGGAPGSLYGACAVSSGFGWPCGATAGVDPSDCTDPSYPYCFVGGQGSWCTKSCAVTTDCTTGVADAGCVPSQCNARGYCK